MNEEKVGELESVADKLRFCGKKLNAVMENIHAAFDEIVNIIEEEKKNG